MIVKLFVYLSIDSATDR